MARNVTYRPAVLVHLTLRIDETLVLNLPPAPDPLVDADTAALLGPDGMPGRTTVPGRPTTPLAVRRGHDNASFVTGIVPAKATIEFPSYRQAGTFRVSLPYRQLPLDPRCVRAAAVEIHMGTVRDDDFASGIGGRRQDDLRVSQLQGTRLPDGTPNPRTLAMIGNADTWEVEHTDSGSEVVLVGRDARGVLLDSHLVSPADTRTRGVLDRLDLSQPIDFVVADILAAHSMLEDMQVVTNPAEWPDGVPAPGHVSAAPRHRLDARGTRRSARHTPASEARQLNYWDLIVRLCAVCGAIPTFRGTNLVIRPVRSIYDQQNAGFDPHIATPFWPDAPREDASMRPPTKFSVRRLVYGRDVERLTFTRKYAGMNKPKVIRCVGHDPTRGRGQLATIEAFWPLSARDPRTRAARGTQALPHGDTHAELVNVPCPGITDHAQLESIARSLYEEAGRNEITGNCSTGKKLASFGGDNSDPDLLRLRPGDGIEFLVDTRALRSGSPLVATLIDAQRLGFDDAVRALWPAHVRDENLARTIVASARGLVFDQLRFFRVASSRFEWDNETGIDVSFDFQNYITPRLDIAPPPAHGRGTLRRHVTPRRAQPGGGT